MEKKPTLLEGAKHAAWQTVKEWRILSILALLLALIIMLIDVDKNIKWGIFMNEISEGKPTYEDIKMTMKEHPSFMSYYTRSSDSKSFYLELPLQMLKNGSSHPFVISAMFAKGLLDEDTNVYLLRGPAGHTDHKVFFFNITADRSGVDMVRQQFLITTTSPEDELAVDLGALSSRVVTLPIVAINQAGANSSAVVDAAELLKRGFFVADVEDAASYRVDFGGCTAFPGNMAVTVEYMIPLSDDDPSLVPVYVVFSLALLPAEPMKPRALDTRIGYFYHAYTDLGDHRQDANFSTLLHHESEGVDTRIRVINRRRLKSGPDFKPITYYIDPTVPEKWRPAFKAGVEAWRPAFAAAGFGNEAIRAVLPGDADWPSDYASGDVRYSTINWVVSLGHTFALGPTVVDPRSGEILDSDIIFTHGWIKHYIGTFEAEDIVVNSPGQGVASHDHSHDDDDDEHGDFWRKRGIKRRAASMAHHRFGSCQEDRMKNDMSPFLARLAIGGGNPLNAVSDDILNAGIKDVVMHEVGHTLGLRHNFKASSGTTWDQTQDYAFTQENGLAISVMDYLPINLVSGRKPDAKVDYFTPVIGPYDILAIRYGYLEVPDEKPGMPHPNLTAMVDANAMPFATDEDDSSAKGSDPSVSTFDFTADPARYFLDRLDLVAELRPTLLDRTVVGGDEYLRFSGVDNMLRNTTFHAARYLVKYIGGYTIEHRRRAMTGEHPSPPVEVVAGTEQARALKGIIRVLTDDEGELFMKPDSAAYAVERRGECTGFWEHCLARAPVDMLKHIDDGRKEVLTTLLNETRLSRLRTSDWMLRGQGKESLSVPDLLTSLTEALWGPDLAASPRLEVARSWSMAVAYVDRLLDLAKSKELAPEIVVSVGGELFKIQDSITAAMDSGKVTPKSPTYPLLRTVQVRLQGMSYYLDAPPKKR